jgi:hypothetical protein
MKAGIILFTALPFFVGGCSRPGLYWYRHDKTIEQARADYCRCEQKAREEATEAVTDDYLDHNLPVDPPGSYSEPQDGGSLSPHDPFDAWLTWGDTYKRNIFAGCMKQKGYQQVKPYRLPSNARTKSLSMGAIAGR